MNKWRGRVVLLTAALSLLLVAPAASNAAERPCNGAVELCSRTLDQVVFPGTHNSMNELETMANGGPEWKLPNQSYTITNQLKRGVRSLLIDTYYGDPNPDGTVGNISQSEGRATNAPTYMCHAFCSLGAVDLTAELGRIKDFLVANPREALIVVNEDYIAPQAFATAVGASGLLPLVYQGSATSFPTLGEMINSGQRVVMLAQNEVGDVPWYHLGYDGPMMETPYSFNQPAQITAPDQLNESCRPNRGSEGSPLFLMNHWVLRSGVLPELSSAQIDNVKESIIARARACEARRGKLPNIIAVDFYGIGDVLGAARELNGVEAKPYLETTAPKPATVRAGRKVVFKVPVANYGDIEAGGVKVCATLSTKLAQKPKCAVMAAIPTNGSGIARITVITKKRYKKARASVKFSISSSEPALTSSAKLTIKPLKKPK